MSDPNLEHIARALITSGESLYTEFKSAYEYGPDEKNVRDVKAIAKDIAETVVAFANADGGDLLVGVEDGGGITGLDVEDNPRRFLESVPRTHVKPDSVDVTVHSLALDGHDILLFRVGAHESEVAVTSEGRCLLRRGSANQPVEPGQIRRRRDENRGLGYEQEPVPLGSIDDLELVSRLGRGLPEHLRELTTEGILRYWNLVEGRNGSIVLRRAALLLFAKDPLRWHPNNRARIRFVRGPGHGARLATREVEVPGPISRLIPDVLRRLRPELEREARLEELFSTSTLLPREAVDECIVNAVAHRNYAIEGSAIEILLYPDKVEFRSPGTLLEPLTVDELRQQRGAHRTRNPVMMRVLRDLGWTRDQGEGMQRIFGSMAQVELHEPDLEVSGDTFVVRLSTRSVYDDRTQAWIAAYGPAGLLPHERKYVLALSEAGGTLSVDKLGRRLNESYDQTKKALDTLEKRGVAWHARRSRQFHLVDPLSVPLERALRRVQKLGIPVDPTATIDAPLVAKLIDASDDAAVREGTRRLVEAGILTPVGKGHRLGKALILYARARGG